MCVFMCDGSSGKGAELKVQLRLVRGGAYLTPTRLLFLFAGVAARSTFTLLYLADVCYSISKLVQRVGDMIFYSILNL